MVRFPPSGPSGRRLLIPVVILLLAMSAACGKSSEADEVPSATIGSAPRSTTSTSTTTEPPEPQLTPEEEVEAAYLEANRVFFSLMEDPDQPLDDLYATRAGEGLEHTKTVVAERREQGLRSRYPEGYPAAEIMSIEVDGGIARLEACEVNDAVVTARDGEILNDDVITWITEVDLVRESGRWRISKEYEIRRRAGRHKCDAL